MTEATHQPRNQSHNQSLKAADKTAGKTAGKAVTAVSLSVIAGFVAVLSVARSAQATATELPLAAETFSGAAPQVSPSVPAKVPAEAMSVNLVLKLSARRVFVYRGDMLVANYVVAVGREGWNTPTGQFSVFQKQIDPAWEHPFTGVVVPPGPDNPLGSRWIGFWSDGTNSIGFHGTPDESVIGSAVSHGCVRMRNEDVLALYEQVDFATMVTVVP